MSRGIDLLDCLGDSVPAVGRLSPGSVGWVVVAMFTVFVTAVCGCGIVWSFVFPRRSSFDCTLCSLRYGWGVHVAPYKAWSICMLFCVLGVDWTHQTCGYFDPLCLTLCTQTVRCTFKFKRMHVDRHALMYTHTCTHTYTHIHTHTHTHTRRYPHYERGVPCQVLHT